MYLCKSFHSDRVYRGWPVLRLAFFLLTSFKNYFTPTGKNFIGLVYDFQVLEQLFRLFDVDFDNVIKLLHCPTYSAGYKRHI
jgi:hypothetical protein